jgi:hypothetical protein
VSEQGKVSTRPPSERTLAEQRDHLIARVAEAEAAGKLTATRARKSTLLAFLRANCDENGQIRDTARTAPTYRHYGDGSGAGSRPEGDSTPVRRSGGGGAKEGGHHRARVTHPDPVNDPSRSARERLRAAARMAGVNF